MTSTALAAAQAYYNAWTAKDFDRAMTYVADDIVCDGPAGRLTGAAEFRAFMEPFTRIVTRTELLAAFGDEDTAVLVYDTDTVPVSGAPGAEWITVRAGKIVHIRIIFDRLPFETARRAAMPRPDEV